MDLRKLRESQAGSMGLWYSLWGLREENFRKF